MAKQVGWRWQWRYSILVACCQNLQTDLINGKARRMRMMRDGAWEMATNMIMGVGKENMNDKRRKKERKKKNYKKTRPSWLNCVLRDDEAIHWVSLVQQWLYLLILSQYKVVLVYSWWHWVSIVLVCLKILRKVDIWSDDTNPWLTNSQTLKDRATQLLRSRSGAFVTQYVP